MKKVLLSLSMLAAVMTANAQFVGIGAYDDFTTQTGDGNATGEYSKQFTSGANTYTGGIFWYKDGEYPATYTLTRANGVMTVAVDKGAEYSVVGAGFGDTGGDGSGTPFTIDISSKQTFSIKLKSTTATPGVTVKVQFEDAAGKKNEAKGVANTEYAMAVTTTEQTFTFDLTGGFGLAWPGPTQVTGFDPTKVAKLNFLISGGAAYKGTVTFDDLKLGNVSVTGLGTASAAANIASTNVFPNPTEGDFNVRLNLNNSSSATIIVSDLMGKQVATQAVVNGTDTRFSTNGLTKGMYTVTYVIDGTPAKSELVVVK